MQEGRFSSL